MIVVIMSNNLDPIRSKRVPRFVEEYCIDRNGTQAAIRAGYTENPDSAGVIAARLLGDVRIQSLVEEEQARVRDRANITAADVLKMWMDAATADPKKVVSTRHLNCRHCWGLGHDYQWGAREYAKACDEVTRHNAAAKKGAPQREMPDCSGGFGWKFNADPNPACPECQGEGIENIRVADMSTLTGAEARLIASVKQGANGIEVKFRDQEKARDHLASYLGMLVERKELTGKDGAPLGIGGLKAEDLTDDQLAAFLAAANDAKQG